jgi:dTMP kinase
MFKKKFFFIVFEGVEGTGKSFQINKLYKSLKKRNLPVIKSREPGGSKNAERIRKLIFEKKSNNLNKITDFYLMLAARNEHLNETILKAKKQKKILICDRFVDSTFAYQVIGNKIKKDINFINNKYILKDIKPNLTIILKSNMKNIFKRLKKRKIKNKFDKLNKSFYLKTQKAFLNIAKNNKDYFVFDSSNNDNFLEKKIFDLIIKKIKFQ